MSTLYLVKPCCSTAHWDPIEVLEGGYGHSIGPSCVPSVPPGSSHHGPHGLRDGPRGPKIRMSGNMSKSASSTLYAFGLNSYITPFVANAILINSEDIDQLWIFGPRGLSRSQHGSLWEGHGGTPGTQPGPMLCGHILPQIKHLNGVPVGSATAWLDQGGAH